MSLRMAATSQGSGGIRETTLGEMAGVSMNRARDRSGERPMALPNMHSQMMLWNCSNQKETFIVMVTLNQSTTESGIKVGSLHVASNYQLPTFSFSNYKSYCIGMVCHLCGV